MFVHLTTLEMLLKGSFVIHALTEQFEISITWLLWVFFLTENCYVNNIFNGILYLCI